MKNEEKTRLSFEDLPDFLRQIYFQVLEMQNKLAEIKQNFQPKVPEELMSRAEVSELLKCDESTVHNWTKKGKLVKHCLGNRTYYKRSEVEAAIKKI